MLLFWALKEVNKASFFIYCQLLYLLPFRRLALNGGMMETFPG